jgi:hypothetical protein
MSRFGTRIPGWFWLLCASWAIIVSLPFFTVLWANGFAPNGVTLDDVPPAFSQAALTWSIATLLLSALIAYKMPLPVWLFVMFGWLCCSTNLAVLRYSQMSEGLLRIRGELVQTVPVKVHQVDNRSGRYQRGGTYTYMIAVVGHPFLPNESLRFEGSRLFAPPDGTVCIPILSGLFSVRWAAAPIACKVTQ